jgi:hypothetical protein
MYDAVQPTVGGSPSYPLSLGLYAYMIEVVFTELWRTLVPEVVGVQHRHVLQLTCGIGQGACV